MKMRRIFAMVVMLVVFSAAGCGPAGCSGAAGEKEVPGTENMRTEAVLTGTEAPGDADEAEKKSGQTGTETPGDADEAERRGKGQTADTDVTNPGNVLETEGKVTEDVLEALDDTVEAFAVTEMSMEKYAKSAVNVRKTPDISGEKIGSLVTNQKVTVTGQAETGWYRINYKNQIGFVSGKYLQDEKVSLGKQGGNAGNRENADAAGGLEHGDMENADTAAAQASPSSQQPAQTQQPQQSQSSTQPQLPPELYDDKPPVNENGLTPDQQANVDLNKLMEEEAAANAVNTIPWDEPEEFVPSTNGSDYGLPDNGESIITIIPND